MQFREVLTGDEQKAGGPRGDRGESPEKAGIAGGIPPGDRHVPPGSPGERDPLGEETAAVTWDEEMADGIHDPEPRFPAASPRSEAQTPSGGTDLGAQSYRLYGESQSQPPAGNDQSDPPTEEVTPSTTPVPSSATSQLPDPQPRLESPSVPPLADPAAASTHFFPIPDDLPDVPHEDTEEVRKPIVSRRVRRRRGPLSMLFNALIWAAMTTFFVAAIVAVLYFRQAYNRLNNSRPEMTQIAILTVNPGDRFGTIVDRLEEAGILRSQYGLHDRYLMWLLTHLEGNSERIQSGVYRLNASMSLREIYSRLIEGSRDFKITIPEGRTTRGVAALVRRKVDTFEPDRFVELANNPDFIASLGLDTDTLEGYLYPSTYFYGPGMSEEELIRMMVKTFKDTVGEAVRDIPTTSGLTPHEHLIMASLIEREARNDQERPLIASVLYNRLAKGMPLQVDATVQFALGDYSKPPRPEDMKVDSPFNTYLHKGLPPGPICNPRLASIVATYQPEPSDYLFYVHKGDGSHAFARTFEEHKENVRLYLKSDTAARKLDAPGDVTTNSEAR